MFFFFLLVSFYAYGSKKKGAGSVDIPYFDSHLHCCGECPGRHGGGANEKVSECAEKLQAWAEARAAVSLIGLLAV